MLDEVDRLIAALLRILLRGWPTAAQSHAATTDDTRALVAATLQRAPALFTRARNRAYAVAHEESGQPTPPDRHRAEPDLAAWWAEQTGTLTALLDADIPPAVVVARTRSLLEREASTQVSAAHGEGIKAVADGLGLSRLLTPERDACLRCTSYAGAVARPGHGFAVVRNFTAGDLESEVEAPLHPRCRCTTRVLYSDQEGAARSDALRREAERAVLRFESLPSESDRARTEAAERLLAQGSRLAKTVLATAERRIRQRRKAEAAAKAGR